MCRLTEKNTKFADVLETMVFCKVEKMYNKLQQLEDIEEELGIDLITLLKALMNGIYVVDDGEILEETISGIERFNDGWGFSTYYNDFELTFSEYGKYWALTREELEVLK